MPLLGTEEIEAGRAGGVAQAFMGHPEFDSLISSLTPAFYLFSWIYALHIKSKFSLPSGIHFTPLALAVRLPC